ncbi:hypothetical protein COOONC_10201 [Cooperia oncophora]
MRLGVPPGFEGVLPPNIIQQLKDLDSSNLSFQQRHERFEQIMSSVPPALLAKLPFPPFFNNLPADVRAKLEQIHRDPTLTWSQRHQKTHTIFESLPPEPPSPSARTT